MIVALPRLFSDLFWCARLEKLWESLAFRGGSGGWLTVIGGGVAVAWVLCGGLHAWLLLFSCEAAVRASESVAASSCNFN